MISRTPAARSRIGRRRRRKSSGADHRHMTLPLGLDEFADRVDRLGFFESDPLVAVAVSGGPDSLALAILADRWARRRGGRICALSVDHGLRAESGAEIRQLGEWLAARSIRHAVLIWH